ncbi:MAG TPA: hypothetical protein VFE24_14715 [Pirellulales bacterium]|jgi:hypothetical protein|nr:hypothetical protein [Pirellulales bacterium]
MLRSVCTLADHRAYDELLVMLKSLSLFADLELFVGCDRVVESRLRNERLRNPLRLIPFLPENLTVKQGTPEFIQLVNRKADILEIALEGAGNALFADADQLFFGPPWGLDLETHEVCLSRHMILESDEAKYGKYNAGYLAASSRRFPAWWREKTKTSKFYEQACLDDAGQDFRVQEITMHHNFGWWRLNQCDPKRKWWRIDLPHKPQRRERLEKFRVEADRILFDEQPLVSIHTHFLDRQTRCYQSTNRLAVELLGKSTDARHREILSWL